MIDMEKEAGLAEALAAYDFGGQVAGALRFGKGHINDTFAVYTQRADGGYRRFILQRVNTHVFADPVGLMENILGVTSHLRQAILRQGGDPERETLTVLPTRAGGHYHRGGDGGFWRVYRFVENAVCYQTAESPAVYRASAVAFGRFAHMLEDYPAHTLHETIPHFHDTPARFTNFLAALEADTLGRAAGCREEIEFALARRDTCDTLTRPLGEGLLPLRVTHNDTKLNNIMMDPASPKGVCVIDLDTVMPGLGLYDYGDAIRFGAHTATEDERDLGCVAFSLPLFETYTAGYLEAAGPSLTVHEKRLLPWGARLMTYECGLRFLTDYLEGDTYFKTNRPGHNLDRCRTQFKLVADMEANFSAMEEIVYRLANMM